MKVYVVVKDNDAVFEYYYQWVERVFDTKKKAKKFIKIEQLKPENKAVNSSNVYTFDKMFYIEAFEVE